MKKFIPFLMLLSLNAFAETIYFPNIPGYATGTQTGGKNAADVNVVAGTITATNPSVGLTGAAVPTSGTYAAGNKAGNLTGLLVGQQTSANSLACVMASDQSAIPVSESGTWNINNISGTITLPSGAATAANQTSIIAALGSPFQAGGSIGNTSFGISGTLPAFASTPTFNLGTLNGAATAANQATEITALNSIVTNSGKSPVNTTGSGSAAAATVSTVATLTAPANAVGFILMNLDTSTLNIRWAVGRTASATLGQQLQPGRDSGFVPVGANVSICAESGTQNYDIQWVSQ